MTDWIIITILLVLVAGICYLNYKVEAKMRIATPGSPAAKIQQERVIPWHDRELPWDATHIAWIMLGDGDLGRIHTLYLQTIESFREESDEADSAIGPIITRSIEMEMDIIERGCKSATEIMYAIARIDRQGNECWLALDGSWVARWSEDSDIQNIFGDQRTVTL
jgi:hypothetical protein